MEPPSINGDPPFLAGLRCDAILCAECWDEGRLVEPANMTYLCFEGSWHRLYFDYAIIFWRTADRPNFDPPESDDYCPVIIDVASQRGLLGIRLLDYEMTPIENGSRVTFAFENGHGIAFESVDDISSYHDV